MGFGTVGGVTKHTSLTDKEVTGVIDHANASVSDAKLASGVGLEDGQICKLPTAVANKVLVRGASAWKADDVPAGGVANVAFGSITWSGAGSLPVTGLGFKPKVVLFFIAVNGGLSYPCMCQGVDDGTSHACKYSMGDTLGFYTTTDYSILVYVDATHYTRGYISSMDADGFTILFEGIGDTAVLGFYVALK